MKLFISGTDTDAGKTLCSAIISYALEADYWKPIQTGTRIDSDRGWIEGLQLGIKTHPEAYEFTEPVSPHYAAALENSEIDLDSITLPESNKLVIEGAGGLLVPINQDQTLVDLIRRLETPVVLVSRHKLGSINHSLLSLHLLKQFNIPVFGVLYSGNPIGDTEDIIHQFHKVPNLGRIPETESIKGEFIKNQGLKLRAAWREKGLI